MSERDTFFQWQARALGGLMGWGAANVVVGTPLARSTEQVTRQIARQAVAWGLIDLLIAVLGRRGARRQGRTARFGDAGPAPTRLRRIIAVNVVLDIGYVLGGAWLVRTAGRRADRRGVGLGIMLQGAFLGCYDGLLLRGVARWVHPVSTD
ncbi:MAG: hypothetical protein H0X37_23745 [Herpetosiphonaceae bacterium]|nr:hypothetical protein [Herpetosiphonaceae bacterium]